MMFTIAIFLIPLEVFSERRIFQLNNPEMSLTVKYISMTKKINQEDI